MNLVHLPSLITLLQNGSYQTAELESQILKTSNEVAELIERKQISPEQVEHINKLFTNLGYEDFNQGLPEGYTYQEPTPKSPSSATVTNNNTVGNDPRAKGASSAALTAQERQDRESKRFDGKFFSLAKTHVKARSKNQDLYLRAIAQNDVVFGIGPAGSGKTFLAVASAVEALLQNKVRKIILTRPAVEAGENLGFLPGDLNQKLDPYLRPLFDALEDLLKADTVKTLIERGIIEIAPLAYMRGRTLNNAFIILDEAQNTSISQMKMFLTRLGHGSTMVITGDETQIDLPKKVYSGLKHAQEVFKYSTAVRIYRLEAEDIHRHPTTAKIVQAYDEYEELYPNPEELAQLRGRKVGINQMVNSILANEAKQGE